MNQQNINKRQLQASPTAVTLMPQKNSRLQPQQIPPLISINEIIKQNSPQSKLISNPQARELTKTPSNSNINPPYRPGNGNASQMRAKGQLGMNKGKKIYTNPQNNASKFVYNAKSKNSQQSLPPHQMRQIDNDRKTRQKSVAQSVYLDLEQYSSIHKYQSMSPNFQQFQEDKEYVQYLINHQNLNSPDLQRPIHTNIQQLSINLQPQEQMMRSPPGRNRLQHHNSQNINNTGNMNGKIPKLAIHTDLSSKVYTNKMADPDDTINQFDDQMTIHAENGGTQKIRRIQSSTSPSNIPNANNSSSKVNTSRGGAEQRGQINMAKQIIKNFPHIAKYLSLQVPQTQSQPLLPLNQQKSGSNVQLLDKLTKYSAQFNKIEQQQQNIRQSHYNSNNQYAANPSSIASDLQQQTMKIYSQYLAPYLTAVSSSPMDTNLGVAIQNSVNISNNTGIINSGNGNIFIKTNSNSNFNQINPNTQSLLTNLTVSTTGSPSQWLHDKSSQALLRIILTKPNRLQQFLKYIIELQIKLRKSQFWGNIQSISDRTDTLQANHAGMQNQPITVHFDVDKNKLQSKQKQSASQTQHLQQLSSSLKKLLKQKEEKAGSIFKQVQSEIEDKQPNMHKNKLRQSIASGSYKSDFISSFNVFNQGQGNNHSLIHNNKNKHKFHFPVELEEIHSQIDMEENQVNFVNFPTRKNKGHTCIQQIQVLKILQTLLVKLSNKKCNIYVKQREKQRQYGNKKKKMYENQKIKDNKNNLQMENLTLSTVSKGKTSTIGGLFMFNQQKDKTKSQLNYKNNQAKGNQGNLAQIHIQFEQYLTMGMQDSQKNRKKLKQQNIFETSSQKQTTYSQKIKQLTKTLQRKQKQIEQIKSSYDYVISNYIKTITNLKKIDIDSIQNFALSKSGNFEESILKSRKQSRKGSPRATFKQSNIEKIYNSIREEDQQNDKKQDSEDSWYNKGKNKKGQNENVFKLNDNELQHFRQSQPMTFQMSRNGNNDSRQEQQWMGTPTLNTAQKSEKEGNNFRHSLPEKSENQNKQENRNQSIFQKINKNYKF